MSNRSGQVAMEHNGKSIAEGRAFKAQKSNRMIEVDINTKVHSRSSSPAFGNAMLQAVPTSEVYLMDCVEGMKHYPDKWFDLACVDIPYGLGDKLTQGGTWASKYKKGDAAWDKLPTLEYFVELFRVSKEQIIWGGNYADLPASRGFIIWDKVALMDTMADCEFAWTSFDKNAKIFRHVRNTSEKRIHITQKPVALYDFCFQFAKVEAGMKILDTHLGSGSSRISANKYQLNFVGFETDEEYFNKQNKRYDDFISQTRLF